MISPRRPSHFVIYPLLAIAASTGCCLAAKIPTSLNDNVVTCSTLARCVDKVMFGRNYKVLETAKFTVMVSISNEGPYTRADVSITNNGGYPQNVSPQDFRVEVLSPKPKILLYVPPAELHDLPAAAAPAANAAVHVANATPLAANAMPRDFLAPVPADIILQPPALEPAAPAAESQGALALDGPHAPTTQQPSLREAMERQAAQEHLVAAPIPANDVVRGRVYFERDPKAKRVNVVLPVAGTVFEFPYSLSH